MCIRDRSGGGGCGCGGGSILIANTDLGDTYQYADDFDNDGWEDDFDNCPFSANADQGDGDADGFGDSCDNCASASNPGQLNADGDAEGDSCDLDADNDSIPNATDNCGLFPNPDQVNGTDDPDRDGMGSPCDTDDDNDGVLDPADNCPLIGNPGQEDVSGQGSCNADADDDGIPDSRDNCPFVSGLDIDDSDGDGQGNACDIDNDNDGIADRLDNCRFAVNGTQTDADRDGFGDTCDTHFCFQVDTADRCLDPQAPFMARPGSDVEIKTGETIRLRLFSNRRETGIRYVWAVDSSPAGSRNFAIRNPRGSVTHSSPWEYHYQADRIATFLANEPGEYVVRLESELAVDDVAFPGQTKDLQTFKVKVVGQSIGLPLPASGCSASGSSVPTIAGLAVLMMLLRRRR